MRTGESAATMTLGLFPPSSETPEQQAKARLKGTAPHIACQDNLRFMEGLASESMKLIVTSPPYNIGKDYEKKAPLEAYVRPARNSSQGVCPLAGSSGIDLLADGQLRSPRRDRAARCGLVSGIQISWI